MAQLISMSIDKSAFDLFPCVTSKNGKEYVSITVAVNDTADKYGKTVQVWAEQSKEDREAKAPKSFCGSGKVIWQSAGQSRHPSVPPATARDIPPPVVEEDLPF